MRTKAIIMTTVLSSVLCGSIFAGAEMGDRDPMGILRDMAGTIADPKQFRVTIRSNYDVLQADGKKVEFGAEHRVQVRRPDGLRVETQRVIEGWRPAAIHLRFTIMELQRNTAS
jgi:hypothetical protein